MYYLLPFMLLEDNIRTLMQAKGWTEAELSRRAKVNQPTVHRILSSFSKEPRHSTLVKIAQALGTTVEALREGEIEQAIEAAASPLPSLYEEAQHRANGNVAIPIYDVEVSAGDGVLVADEQINELVFVDAEWLRRNAGVNPNHKLGIVRVTGDSMQQTYNPGDLIVVDFDDPAVLCNSPVTDGIYCLQVLDSVRVKRLQLLMSGKVRVISDNPAYPMEEVDPSDLRIIARAHFSWRGLRC